jgi:hypothetical protein
VGAFTAIESDGLEELQPASTASSDIVADKRKIFPVTLFNPSKTIPIQDQRTHLLAFHACRRWSIAAALEKIDWLCSDLPENRKILPERAKSSASSA